MRINGRARSRSALVAALTAVALMFAVVPAAAAGDVPPGFRDWTATGRATLAAGGGDYDTAQPDGRLQTRATALAVGADRHSVSATYRLRVRGQHGYNLAYAYGLFLATRRPMSHAQRARWCVAVRGRYCIFHEGFTPDSAVTLPPRVGCSTHPLEGEILRIPHRRCVLRVRATLFTPLRVRRSELGLFYMVGVHDPATADLTYVRLTARR